MADGVTSQPCSPSPLPTLGSAIAPAFSMSAGTIASSFQLPPGFVHSIPSGSERPPSFAPPPAFAPPPSMLLANHSLVNKIDHDTDQNDADRGGISPPRTAPAKNFPLSAAKPRNSSTICSQCGKPIAGKGMQTLGKFWHIECFVCAKCSQPMQSGEFVEVCGRSFCPSCATTALESPESSGQVPQNTQSIEEEGEGDPLIICAKCSGIIGEQDSSGFIEALNKTWHPDCFVCGKCSASLAQGYALHNGIPLCRSCKKATKPPKATVSSL